MRQNRTTTITDEERHRRNLQQLQAYRPLDDGAHILYVNGAYVGNSDIGKLMHDFRCSNADDMYFEQLAVKTRYLKENTEGVSYMSKLMEERLKEEAVIVEHNRNIQFALKLLERGKDSFDEISELTGLTLEEVQGLVAESQSITA